LILNLGERWQNSRHVFVQPYWRPCARQATGHFSWFDKIFSIISLYPCKNIEILYILLLFMQFLGIVMYIFIFRTEKCFLVVYFELYFYEIGNKV